MRQLKETLFLGVVLIGGVAGLVSLLTDIKGGDLLVTSGLGGRFPVGYPVARVTSIIDDPGQPFLNVSVAPTARLSQSRHVLLVFSGRQVAEVSADD